MWVIFRLLTLSIISLLAQNALLADSAKSGEPVFALERMLDGEDEQVKLDKPRVLSFWASWCSNCGKTIDVLSKSSLKESLMTVSLDSKREDAFRAFTASKKTPYLKRQKNAAYWDKGSVMRTFFSIQALPTVLVVDEKGKKLMSLHRVPRPVDIVQMKKHLEGKK